MIQENNVGIIDNMKAELIIHYRNVPRSGELIEMVIWRLPKPVPPSIHAFKYRLAWIVGGHRRIGFDNERGKGDHKHVGNAEHPYDFAGVDRLIEDFRMEVERWNAR